MTPSPGNSYDVVIIGAGVTGTALAYVLMRYTNATSIAVIEKYSRVAEVNSKSTSNSQTLHVGDIETNYSLEKARKMKQDTETILRYGAMVSEGRRDSFLFKTQKMVLAVGDEEVAELEKRFEEFKSSYPKLRKLSRDDIAKIEPAVVYGRKPDEKILALGTEKGYAVNFGKLAESLLKDAQKTGGENIETYFETKVSAIKRKDDDRWNVETDKGIFTARTVAVAAGSHSLLFARMLGYGGEISIIPIAGNFYFTPQVLRGKVYTMQSKKLPFAAVHGDPDILVPGKTRFGPTARFSLVLERRKLSTAIDYFRSAGFDFAALASIAKILSDKEIFLFLAKNILYDVPILGKRLFIKSVQKIAPSVRLEDLTFAKGIGGMRTQIIDKNKRAIRFGEGKIVGEGIIFNLTPSPGASACIANAYRDANILAEFPGSPLKVDTKKFNRDFLSR